MLFRSGGGEIVALVRGVGIELEGDPDVWRGAEVTEIEIGIEDADDHVGNVPGATW